MVIYHVNKKAQPNGDHEVHQAGCAYQPAPENRLQLGGHPGCATAVRQAKKYYPRANGCAYCSPSCHTS